ncbi:MAG TPA: GntR family transcriptional regulator [Verrucomicrobiae bacterium]|nr:GntR family transcriptional regulator [Verrucomicrobiae bacterium]
MCGCLGNYTRTAPSVILDRSSAVPLYFQVYQHLLDQIQSGALQPGQPIPSEPELAGALGISRMTVRQAVKALCDAGATYSKRGLGTFVTGRKQVKTSTELLSFTQETKAAGGKPSSRVLAFGELRVEAEVAAALHLEANAKVFRLKRVRIADSVPMSIEESFLPAKLCPRLLETFDPRTSLYQVLAENYGIRMTAADEVAEASLARPEEARLLGIKKDSPVFVMTRISYAETSQPVEFVRSTYRGDRWKLVSHLTPNPNMEGNMAARKPVALLAAQPASRRRNVARVGNGHRPKNLSNLPNKQEKL